MNKSSPRRIQRLYLLIGRTALQRFFLLFLRHELEPYLSKIEPLGRYILEPIRFRCRNPILQFLTSDTFMSFLRKLSIYRQGL